MLSSFFYFLFKLLEQIVVAIKYIDVYLATYATHSAIGRQLPNGKMHIWLILAIACYPHLIVVAKIFAIGIAIIQVFIDERLTDIQYRTHFHHMFYANEPFPHSSNITFGPPICMMSFVDGSTSRAGGKSPCS